MNGFLAKEQRIMNLLEEFHGNYNDASPEGYAREIIKIAKGEY